MEVSGVNGHLKLNDSTLTILWTTLSGRLRNSGAELEVVPLEKILEHVLIHATSVNLGNIQIKLLIEGNSLNPINRDSEMTTFIKSRLIVHSILFHESSLLNFMNFEKELSNQISKARARSMGRFIGTDESTASS